jgi:hypothetical protein
MGDESRGGAGEEGEAKHELVFHSFDCHFDSENTRLRGIKGDRKLDRGFA